MKNNGLLKVMILGVSAFAVIMILSVYAIGEVSSSLDENKEPKLYRQIEKADIIIVDESTWYTSGFTRGLDEDDKTILTLCKKEDEFLKELATYYVPSPGFEYKKILSERGFKLRAAYFKGHYLWAKTE